MSIVKDLLEKIKKGEQKLINIKEGERVKGKIVKKLVNGLLVDIEDGIVSGVILPKEVKELDKMGYDLTPGSEVEVEIVAPDIIEHEDGLIVVSITQILQHNTREDLIQKYQNDEVFTVVPTEANLGGLLVDMHGIKGFIPLSQLAPLHYPRVEDGNQDEIFRKLLDLIGVDIKVRIINIDKGEKRVILSEREAYREEREKLLKELEVGKVFEGVISGVSSYGFFVTIGGIMEGLVHISEITYGHVNNIHWRGKVGDKIKVKVIGLEGGSRMSLSIKQLKPDPWTIIPKKYKVGDVIEGEVVRFVPYGVFIRVYDDINGLVHRSELPENAVRNPHKVFRIGEKVKAKIILLDPNGRKIGLSIKALEENNSNSEERNEENKEEKSE